MCMNIWRSIIQIGPGKRTTCLLLENRLGKHPEIYLFFPFSRLHQWQCKVGARAADWKSHDHVSLSSGCHAQIVPQTKGHSEASGMGENHQSQGKGALGGETLKTLLGCSEEATWNTQAIWNTQVIRKRSSWGCHWFMVRSLVVLMTIILLRIGFQSKP